VEAEFSGSDQVGSARRGANTAAPPVRLSRARDTARGPRDGLPHRRCRARRGPR
jgi:hypothetical protein